MVDVAAILDQVFGAAPEGASETLAGRRQCVRCVDVSGYDNPLCTAPGSLDNSLHYAAALRLAAIQRSLAAVGLTRPFFSTSHSVL